MFLGAGFLLSGVRQLRNPSAGASFSPLTPPSAVFEALDEAERNLRESEVLAGFLSYECAPESEGRGLPPFGLNLPLAAFGVYPLPTDHFGLPSPELPGALIPVPRQPPRSVFEDQVDDIRARIGRGDIFQANLSFRDHARWEGDEPDWRAFAARALEARYGALIDGGEWSILSASPELFLSLDGDTLVSEPIKGTRPRGQTSEEDERLREELLSDEKDRAENVMIADLMRNDLARVCRDSTLREDAICELKTFPEVHHLVSRIEGRLREGKTFTDAIRAAFPCGSITGAPKLAAMAAIAELEGEGRGPYCGTIFVRTRSMGTASVAIRTAAIDRSARIAEVRSGGGITILSHAGAEYEEADAKAYLFRMLTGRNDRRHR